MQIQTSAPFSNATQTASNALNGQFTHLNSISQSINHSLVDQSQNSVDNQQNYTAPNYSALNSTLSSKNELSSSVESNLLDLNTTKSHALSLLKVMAVENNIHSSLGKIFDNWA